MIVLKSDPEFKQLETSCTCGARLVIERGDLFKGRVPGEPANVRAMWECSACGAAHNVDLPVEEMLALPEKPSRIKPELSLG